MSKCGRTRRDTDRNLRDFTRMHMEVELAHCSTERRKLQVQALNPGDGHISIR
jgi:hypothetical protein